MRETASKPLALTVGAHLWAMVMAVRGEKHRPQVGSYRVNVRAVGEELHSVVYGIDYRDAVSGNLRLIPSEDAAGRLRRDYDAMLDGGFLGGWRPRFDEVLGFCEQIQIQANATAPA